MAGKILASLSALLTLDPKGFNNGLKSAKGQANAFAKSISQIGPMVAGAFSVAAVVTFTKKSLELAGSVEGVEKAFKRLDRAEMLLNNLKRATHNTVSELELMKAAVQWNNFQLPLEKLPAALEFAQIRAKETGQSVEYLVDSIVRGLGRKSVLILDNLGLSVTDINSEIDRTGDFFQGVFNIINREIGKSGEYVETYADKVGQLRAAWVDFQTKIGGMITGKSGGIAGWLRDMIDYLSWGIDEVKRKGASFGEWWDWFWQTGKYGWENYVEALENKRKADELINQTLSDIQNWTTPDGKRYGDKEKSSQEPVKKGYEEITEELKILNQQLLESIATNDGMSRSIANQIIQLQKQKEYIENVSKALTDASRGFTISAMGGQAGTPLFKEKKATMPGMLDERSMSVMSAFTDKYEDFGQRIIDVNQLIADSFYQLGASFGQAIGDMITGEKDFSQAVKSILADVIRLIAGLLAQVIATAFAGGASVGGPAAAATGAASAAAAAALFGSVVPAVMASGGIVPPGYPNDTYPALLTSGETVTPPGALPGGMDISGRFIIRGSDLVYIINKENTKRANYK